LVYRIESTKNLKIANTSFGREPLNNSPNYQRFSHFGAGMAHWVVMVFKSIGVRLLSTTN